MNTATKIQPRKTFIVMPSSGHGSGFARFRRSYYNHPGQAVVLDEVPAPAPAWCRNLICPSRHSLFDIDHLISALVRPQEAELRPSSRAVWWKHGGLVLDLEDLVAGEERERIRGAVDVEVLREIEEVGDECGSTRWLPLEDRGR